MFTHFVAKSEKCRKYAFLGGSTQIITILHRRGHWNLLQYYKGGGSSQFITILQGGGGRGGSRDPKFVLRNIWTAPYLQNDVMKDSLLRFVRILQRITHNRWGTEVMDWSPLHFGLVFYVFLLLGKCLFLFPMFFVQLCDGLVPFVFFGLVSFVFLCF